MAPVKVNNIYYLGPDGSNSYLAMKKALRLCEINAENEIPAQSISTALESLENDKSAFCVLPCENSIDGIVRETVDRMINLKDSEIKIKGELVIPIEHCLLTKVTNKKDIKLIISHPQALAQCRNFLRENYPWAKIKDVSSTSYAAEKASRSELSEGIAAVANSSCADIYGLFKAETGINDEKDNKTRFFVTGRDNLDGGEQGKTALIVSTKNIPGSLCNVLKIFEKHKINLTCIDSRPSKKKLGEYLFFIELEGIINTPGMATAIIEINLFANFVKVLGSFATYK